MKNIIRIDLDYVVPPKKVAQELARVLRDAADDIERGTVLGGRSEGGMSFTFEKTEPKKHDNS